MGLSLRKSFKLVPGLRLNVSTRGVGLSTGVRGARVSVGPRGVNVYGGVGPVRYAKKIGGGRRRSSSSSNGLGCLVLIGVVVATGAVVNLIEWFHALPQTTRTALVASVVVIAVGGVVAAIVLASRREAQRIAAERASAWADQVKRIEAMLNAAEALQRPATRLSRADEAVRIVRSLEAAFPDEAAELMAQIERWTQSVVYDVLIEEAEELASAGDETRARLKYQKALELLRADQIDDEKQADIIAELESRIANLNHPGSVASPAS